MGKETKVDLVFGGSWDMRVFYFNLKFEDRDFLVVILFFWFK